MAVLSFCKNAALQPLVDVQNRTLRRVFGTHPRTTEVKNHTFRGGTHCQGIELAIDDEVFKVINIYAHPRAKIHYDSNEFWGNQDPSKTVLAGDFNAKCQWLGYNSKANELRMSDLMKNED